MTTSMDRKTAAAIQKDMNAALGEVAKKWGLKSLEIKRVTYTASTIGGKVDGIVEGGKSKEAQRYDANRELLGLPPLGTWFVWRNDKYTTAGLNTTGSKVLVTLERTGVNYWMPVGQVSKYTMPDGAEMDRRKQLIGEALDSLADKRSSRRTPKNRTDPERKDTVKRSVPTTEQDYKPSGRFAVDL